jgi:hypothetical protein
LAHPLRVSFAELSGDERNGEQAPVNIVYIIR